MYILLPTVLPTTYHQVTCVEVTKEVDFKVTKAFNKIFINLRPNNTNNR
jgi:hypothetical protein